MISYDATWSLTLRRRALQWLTRQSQPLRCWSCPWRAASLPQQRRSPATTSRAADDDVARAALCDAHASVRSQFRRVRSPADWSRQSTAIQASDQKRYLHHYETLARTSATCTQVFKAHLPTTRVLRRLQGISRTGWSRTGIFLVTCTNLRCIWLPYRWSAYTGWHQRMAMWRQNQTVQVTNPFISLVLSCRSILVEETKRFGANSKKVTGSYRSHECDQFNKNRSLNYLVDNWTNCRTNEKAHDRGLLCKAQLSGARLLIA